MSLLDTMADIIATTQSHGLDVCEIELADGEVLRFRCRPAARTDDPHPIEIDASHRAGAQPEPTIIKADRMGFFSRQHPLGECVPAAEGRVFSTGDPVAYLVVDDVIHAITAPADGSVLSVLASEGDLIGYGDSLYRFQESARPTA